MRFLAALAAGGSTTFQTFDDTPAKRKHLARVLHGPIDKHGRLLRQLNEQGAGIFVMVNEGDGRGRRALNVRAARALFVDLDGAPLEPVLAAPIPPHVVVETSPGKWHAYWLVDDIPLEVFPHLQGQLAKRFHGDPSIKDVSRVMRLPGYLHQKNGAFMTRLVSVREGPKIAFEAFLEAFELSTLIPVGTRNTSLFSAAAGFKRAGIPVDAAHARVAKLNARNTAAPLEPAEVSALVQNAYRYDVDGFSRLPHAVVDLPDFADLSAAAVKLLVYALRRQRGGGEFALPHSEFRRMVGFTNRRRFRAALEELIDARLLVKTRDYVAGAAEADRVCALYRLHERVHSVP